MVYICYRLFKIVRDHGYGFETLSMPFIKSIFGMVKPVTFGFYEVNLRVLRCLPLIPKHSNKLAQISINFLNYYFPATY